MPGRAPIRAHQGDYEFFKRRKRRGVTFRNRLTRIPQSVALGQLHKTHCRLNIAHVVLESRFEHVVVPTTIRTIALPRVPTDTMEPHEPHSISGARIFCRDHSTFPGRKSLRRIETETGELAELPHSFPVKLRGKGVSRILNYPQVMHPRQCMDLIHIARLPTEMHREDRFRLRRDSSCRVFHA